ncbi:hypothetical protein DIPPA_12357 [Diplonema papillatum]|nr:hypothetical protein DIPPA_12357 [Diplonema papillatum]
MPMSELSQESMDEKAGTHAVGSPASSQGTHSVNGAPGSAKCSNCDQVKPGLRKCPCLLVAYCDDKCQSSHWPIHRTLCAAVRKKEQMNQSQKATAALIAAAPSRSQAALPQTQPAKLEDSIGSAASSTSSRPSTPPLVPAPSSTHTPPSHRRDSSSDMSTPDSRRGYDPHSASSHSPSTAAYPGAGGSHSSGYSQHQRPPPIQSHEVRLLHESMERLAASSPKAAADLLVELVKQQPMLLFSATAHLTKAMSVLAESDRFAQQQAQLQYLMSQRLSRDAQQQYPPAYRQPALHDAQAPPMSNYVRGPPAPRHPMPMGLPLAAWPVVGKRGVGIPRQDEFDFAKAAARPRPQATASRPLASDHAHAHPHAGLPAQHGHHSYAGHAHHGAIGPSFSPDRSSEPFSAHSTPIKSSLDLDQDDSLASSIASAVLED